MNNSLIIGFGKRVKNTVIPALKMINDGNIYVYSRIFEKIILEKNKYEIEPVNEIDGDILKNINRIFICTPNEIFLNIVQKISKFAVNNINLYIDTPLIPKISNIKIEKYKQKFKNIFVLEDFYYNPLNEIINKIIKDNNLHFIKNIEYINSGHSYHSLAQSRYLLNKSSVYFAYKKNDILKFYLKKSQIVINGRRSETGFIIIETSNKKIIINNQIYKSDFKISYIFKENIICGYELNGNKIKLPENINKDFENLKNICKKYNIKLRTLQEQIVSFVQLIIESERESGKKYYLEDGIKDSFICAMINKIKIYADFYHKDKSYLLIIFRMLINLKLK